MSLVTSILGFMLLLYVCEFLEAKARLYKAQAHKLEIENLWYGVKRD